MVETSLVEALLKHKAWLVGETVEVLKEQAVHQPHLGRVRPEPRTA